MCYMVLLIFSKKSHFPLRRTFGSLVGITRVGGWCSDSGMVRLRSDRGQDSDKRGSWRPLVRAGPNASGGHPTEGTLDPPWGVQVSSCSPSELTPSSHVDLTEPLRCDLESIQERKEVSTLERDEHMLQGQRPKESQETEGLLFPGAATVCRKGSLLCLPRHRHKGRGFPTRLRVHRPHEASELNPHLYIQNKTPQIG